MPFDIDVRIEEFDPELEVDFDQFKDREQDGVGKETDNDYNA